METVLAILIEFFNKNTNKSIVIICESADNLAKCRNRLFDQWYRKISKLSANQVKKYDLTITEEGYASLLVHCKNQFHNDIRDAFFDIPNRLAEKDPPAIH
ncbi:DUF6169 family protein [Dyadobacter sp. CY327]|uniref:DUF6169 family protein n=1 Tax=Dyadobacter sp. CY327 TaxID=2907301 RepID=UPI001F41CE50|nr:DUF6169 family protein [Dyadobacter sp. CY327]MCE7072288.1 DUF6169 family protein [Dyadobacter sp. CY327]